MSATAPGSTRLDSGHWQARLDAAVAEHGVAGAGLGVVLGEETLTVTSGWANVAEGIAATPDTLFQIGSITKVWTATQVMQLVDEDRLNLDDRVLGYLPGIVLPDERITVRQLLNHTSGLTGDFFPDCGRGDDALEKYASALADAEQLHPAGQGWSYCNSGYSLLGRLIEVMDDTTWNQSLRARIIEPLGLSHTVTLPEEALRRRTATGHLHNPADGEFTVVPSWGLDRSSGPAGAVCARVADVLTFARLHLGGGRTPQGARILSEASASAMTTATAEVTERWLLGPEMGLGWFLDTWSGEPTWGHTGSTGGQQAALTLVPGAGCAMTLLTNGGSHAALVKALFTDIARELLGIAPPAPPVPAAGAVENPDDYLGTFASLDQVQRITFDKHGTLVIQALDATTGEVTLTAPLRPFTASTLLADLPGLEMFLPVTFEVFDGVRHIHTMGRTKPEATDWVAGRP